MGFIKYLLFSHQHFLPSFHLSPSPIQHAEWESIGLGAKNLGFKSSSAFGIQVAVRVISAL